MKVLVLTFWSFKEGLIQSYTLPYLKQISEHLGVTGRIFLFTMEKENLQMTEAELLKTKENLELFNIELIHVNYRRLGIVAIFRWFFIFFKLVILVFSKKIKFIHAICTPPGVVGYFLSIITQKHLVLDSFEPHSEASVENGDWKPNSLAFRFLYKMEALQAKHATAVIATTRGMYDYAREKYEVLIKNFYVKPACVNLTNFSKKNRKNPFLMKEVGLTNENIVCVYAGKIGGIYLDIEFFDFLRTAYDYWGVNFRALLLTAHSDKEISNWLEKAGIPKSIVIRKFVKHSQIPNYIGLGDFGITPVKPVPSKRFCTPIKNGEYWALGLPIVSTANISDDSELIEENGIGAIIHTLNGEGYLNAIKQIDIIINENTVSELFQKIRPFAERYRSFQISNNIYKEIYKEKLL